MRIYDTQITEVERQVLMHALALLIEHDIITDRVEDAAASELYERLNLMPQD